MFSTAQQAPSVVGGVISQLPKGKITALRQFLRGGEQDWLPEFAGSGPCLAETPAVEGPSTASVRFCITGMHVVM